MFILNSNANFFSAALLCSLFGFFVCFLNFSQISLTPGEDKFIILKKTFILLSCHGNDILLKKAISRIPNDFFLKQLTSLVVISFPKDQVDTCLKIEQNMANIH